MAAKADAESGRPMSPVNPVSPVTPDPAVDGDADGQVVGPAEQVEQVSVWESAEIRYGFLIACAALVFAIDQASKAVIMASMQLGDDIPILPPVLDLHYITNRGVAFGLFSRFGDVFVPVAIVIMAVIVGYYRTIQGQRLWLRLALSLQLGGALGNLLDRLRYGAVVDFIEFHIDAINFHWPVFNLADTAIVIGVGILLFCLTTQQEQEG
jgi:signal peptidase II